MGEVAPWELAHAQALASASHGDPFAYLGFHEGLVRVYVPNARGVRLLGADGGPQAALSGAGFPGLFQGRSRTRQYLLEIDWGGTRQLTEDPYSFGPLLGELDLHLLAEGRHWDLGRVLGAQLCVVQGVAGVRFAVWAPNARRVSVVGDFNSWDGRRHPMRNRNGVWELFIPRLAAGALYKYEILGRHGLLPLKADPVALQAEAAPGTASVVAGRARFTWSDEGWMGRRQSAASAHAPLAIYEVHPGSWRADCRSWEALARQLIPYVKENHFTHIELLPVMSHPFGGSWGYQPLGLFAPQAAYGPPDALRAFIDRCHAQDIGVILDWVPAHFPDDAHGLARFDGTALYEHADPREGMHKDWNTLIYNHGRHEVRGFLIASALHWLEQYHVDGLRVDAVASMLYRDYSRRQGEWVPNRYGGRENLEAVDFLQELNSVVAERATGALMIAEESTAWPGVTRAAGEGGLGFHYKWNMGWMHDSLQYIAKDPLYRSYEHGKLTFGLAYAFSERFVLPISHDEVVHGKASLLGKMPGDCWQRFANLRAYLAFMWTHPGKKLLFMGSEFGQAHEWNHDAELDWAALDRAEHAGVAQLVRDLNRLYRQTPALHWHDGEAAGFQWIIGDDAANSVYAWLRCGAPADEPVLVVCNFTPLPRLAYRVGVPREGCWDEIFNSDAAIYGGSNSGNQGCALAVPELSHGLPFVVSLSLPPLGVIMLQRRPRQSAAAVRA